MKKLTIILIILTFCALSMPRAAFASQCSGYNDVSSTDWFCEAVSALQKIGVLAELAFFNPTQNLNRAEALKTLYEASGKEAIEYSGDFFDISGSSWFKKYFYTAYGSKFIESKEGKMNAGSPITKSEFLVLLMKIFDISPGSGSCTLKATYSDPSSAWVSETNYKGYLCMAQETGLATKEFDVATLNRATAMQILYNALVK